MGDSLCGVNSLLWRVRWSSKAGIAASSVEYRFSMHPPDSAARKAQYKSQQLQYEHASLLMGRGLSQKGVTCLGRCRASSWFCGGTAQGLNTRRRRVGPSSSPRGRREGAWKNAPGDRMDKLSEHGQRQGRSTVRNACWDMCGGWGEDWCCWENSLRFACGGHRYRPASRRLDLVDWICGFMR